MEHYSYSWCCPSNPRDGINTPTAQVWDIQDMVLQWARDLLRKRLPVRDNCVVRRWRTPYTMDELDLQCDWSNIKIKTTNSEIVSFNTGGDCPGSVPLSKSHHINNTETEQTYNFSCNKSTKCRALASIHQGMCIGDRTDVNLPVPAEILGETIEFGKMIRIVKPEGTKVEGDIHWSGQYPIRVPPGSSTVAEVHILERCLNVNFTATTVVSGQAKVYVTDRKDKTKIVKELDNNIAAIVKSQMERTLPYSEDELGFPAIRTEPMCWFPQGCRWDLTKASVSFDVKGTSFFQYGYEQNVKLHHE